MKPWESLPRTVCDMHNLNVGTHLDVPTDKTCLETKIYIEPTYIQILLALRMDASQEQIEDVRFRTQTTVMPRSGLKRQPNVSDAWSLSMIEAPAAVEV